MELKYTKIKEVKDLSRNIEENAGYDFYIPNNFNEGKDFKLYLNEQINIPSGIKVCLPKKTCMIMFNKSGVSIKKGLTVGACVIDESYQGEIHLNLFKSIKGSQDLKDEKGIYTILSPGEKIVQGIVIPVLTDCFSYITNEEYENLPKTERGTNGFGSTGVF